MSGINQTRDELLYHLDEQISFLKSSADSFDEGFLGEAKRMALGIRILVHNTRNSTSLLKQLEIEDKKFLDTASKYDPKNIIGQHLLLSIRITKGGSTFSADLDKKDSNQKNWINFQEWWNSIILADKYKQTLTRKELILSLADQDGGAHVDPKINEKYGNITRLHTLDIFQNKGNKIEEPLRNSNLISVRQITHEVIKTFDKNYEKVGPSPKKIPEELNKTNLNQKGNDQFSVTIKGPKIKNGKVIQEPFKKDKIGRNEPCPCGSGKKYKYCHGE